MTSNAGLATDGSRIRWSLAAVAAAAVALGLYARFKGLGTWSLGVDEFYISRSIDNVLRSGIPEFLCGGLYNRGLLYQYVVAALRLGDLSPEFSARVVTAIASLAVLPAGYLLGVRLHGRIVGLLAVIVLSISVWEVEMARFARMYAPFQAVFMWYMLFFLKYTIDRSRAALAGMLALSVIGILTWEGGALLGLANLLPPFINHDSGRLRRRDWPYLGVMGLLFLALFSLTTDLRGFAAVPEVAADVDIDAADGLGFAAYSPWMTLGDHWSFAIAALVPAGLALLAMRWVWSLRDRWVAALGLATILVLALLHQFAAAGAALVLILLTGLATWRELFKYRARWFIASIGASVVFWMAFTLLTDTWHGAELDGAFNPDRLFLILRAFAGFPDVFEQVVRPWGRTIPIVSLLLFTSLLALTVRFIFREEGHASSISVSLIILLTMVLAIGESGAPRLETRYAFFLYPLMITLALTAVALLCDGLFTRKSRAMAASSIGGLLLFAATEDFQLEHLAKIDSREINFRIGMTADLASHYYPRGDVRGQAEWLKMQVRADDLVMIGVPNVYQYYRDIDYFFLDEHESERYSDYACPGGDIERWTNAHLLFTTDALAPHVRTGRRVFLLLYGDSQERLLDEAARRQWEAEIVAVPVPGGGSVIVLNP